MGTWALPRKLLPSVWSTTMSLTLSSTAFAGGKPIPRRHSGDGEDLSPPLSWSGVPSSARELALIVDDPDAPTKEPWVHWVIYKIPVGTEGFAEGVPPIGHPGYPPTALQGKNSWGSFGYRGPAPPKGHGVHRYFFKLYALDRHSTASRAWTSRACSTRYTGTSWPRVS